MSGQGYRPDLRIVIADDEPDVLALLDAQFSMRPGFEVVGLATNGEEAVEEARAKLPDAVVMDLLMPDVNGFEGIAALQEAFPAMGVVAYTGVAGTFVREEMGSRNVEVVLKSGNLNPLAEAVERSVHSAAAH
ncbi:MAG: response regulator transcription factor [Actinobacteria bacterium]|nr:response regulator transcription factor [Actinomycetota bacterium]MBV8957416.1 response regulator transcription factor [Actinomycetota bacterium]MBV9254557.1 response regulator transcription factor [Actinomycetota bacterium]MBV9664864.1 response regulator transcription factor [Actinomycetota bacterium]MBV9934803.1 response regulator transcription factor [Actinomycetota bacterium]